MMSTDFNVLWSSITVNHKKGKYAQEPVFTSLFSNSRELENSGIIQIVAFSVLGSDTTIAKICRSAFLCECYDSKMLGVAAAYVLVVLYTGLFIYVLGTQIKSGIITNRVGFGYVTVRKDENPLQYWVFIIIEGLTMLIACYLSFVVANVLLSDLNFQNNLDASQTPFKSIVGGADNGSSSFH